jgi:uncharacterized protein YcfL
LGQQLTRTTKVTLLIYLLVGCQAAPPEIQLNEQQQMDLNAIFTRTALQAMEIGTTTGKLKKAKVVEILSESDGEVQGVLTESDWQQYDRTGRDYVAARIQSLVSGRRDLSAAEVAELMGGSGGARMPAIGGHH